MSWFGYDQFVATANLVEERNTAQQKLREANERIGRLNSRLQKSLLDSDRLVEENIKAKKLYDSLQTNHESLNEMYTALEETVIDLRARLADRLEKSIPNEDYYKTVSQLQSVTQSRDTHKNKEKELEAVIVDLRKELVVANNKVESMKNTIKLGEDREAELRSALVAKDEESKEVLSAGLRAATRELDLSLKLEKSQKASTQFENTLRELEERHEALKGFRAELTDEVKRLCTEVERIKEQCETVSDKAEKAERDLQTEKTEHKNTVQRLHDMREGFHNAAYKMGTTMEELEKQRDAAVQKEKDTAKKLAEILARLKEFQNAALSRVYELDVLQRANKELKDQYKFKVEMLERANSLRCKDLEALETAHEQIRLSKAELEQARIDHRNYESQLSRMRSDLDKSRGEHLATKKLLEEKCSANKDLEAEVEEMTARYKAEMTKHSTLFNRHTETLAHLRNSQEYVTELNEIIKRCRKDYRDQENKHARRVTDMQQDHEDVSKKLEQTKFQLKLSKQELDESKNTISRQEALMAECGAKLLVATERYNFAEDRIRVLRNTITDLRCHVEDLTRELEGFEHVENDDNENDNDSDNETDDDYYEPSMPGVSIGDGNQGDNHINPFVVITRDDPNTGPTPFQPWSSTRAPLHCKVVGKNGSESVLNLPNYIQEAINEMVTGYVEADDKYPVTETHETRAQVDDKAENENEEDDYDDMPALVDNNGNVIEEEPTFTSTESMNQEAEEEDEYEEDEDEVEERMDQKVQHWLGLDGYYPLETIFYPAQMEEQERLRKAREVKDGEDDNNNNHSEEEEKREDDNKDEDEDVDEGW